MRHALVQESGATPSHMRPTLLIAAFEATSWLQGLRRIFQDARAGLVAPVLGPAPARLRTRHVDLHRMNPAQARAAVLEAVHVRLQELPGAEVEEARAALLADEMQLAKERNVSGLHAMDVSEKDAGGKAGKSKERTASSSGSAEGGLTLVVGRGLNTPNRAAGIDRNALKLAVLDLCEALQVRAPPRPALLLVHKFSYREPWARQAYA